MAVPKVKASTVSGGRCGVMPFTIPLMWDDAAGEWVANSWATADLDGQALQQIAQNTANTNDAIALVSDRQSTANGFLADLKVLEADVKTLLSTGNGNTADLKTILTAIAGYVDGLEALATTGNINTAGSNTRLDDIKTLLSAGNALMVTLNGYTDQIEGKLDTLNSKLDLLPKGVPANAVRYKAALSLAANPTVYNGACTAWAVMSSGNLTLRDNTTDECHVPGGMVGILPAPVPFATSFKLFAVLATNTTIWYTVP